MSGKPEEAATTASATSFPRRAENARRTRQALIAAAGELFAEIGYHAATIQAIADRAGVARPTVFTSVPGGAPPALLVSLPSGPAEGGRGRRPAGSRWRVLARLAARRRR